MAEEHRTRRHGAFLATAHAGFMHKQGLLSKSELEDVRKAALANHLETMSEDDKYHPAHIDRMRADHARAACHEKS